MKRYSRPHLYPTGRLAIRHRLGMVIATPGLTPMALAVPESRTAQRHFGFRPTFCTLRQQFLETAALASRAAAAHGASCTATLSGGSLPQTLAPVAPPGPVTASKIRRQRTLKPDILVSEYNSNVC